MDVTVLLDHLAAEGPRLAAAAERAGLDAAVPSCPDWTVRDLLAHTGGVHRWAAAIVATRSGTLADAGDGAGRTVPDAELVEWFRAGHTALVQTLGAAPADLDCATFLPAPSPLAFWARRQAHETAIHRCDAEAAAGAVPTFAAGFAQDGIEEVLTGFAARRSHAVARVARISLHAADGPDWLITLGGDRIVAEAADVAPPADAELHGDSSALYRWLWNRPAAVTITGDATVSGLWRTTVRVR